MTENNNNTLIDIVLVAVTGILAMLLTPLVMLFMGYIAGSLVLTIFPDTVTTTLNQLGIEVPLPTLTSAISLAGLLFNQTIRDK